MKILNCLNGIVKRVVHMFTIITPNMRFTPWCFYWRPGSLAKGGVANFTPDQFLLL